MKVTFDIPDGTVCAFLSFVYQKEYTTLMAVSGAKSDELFDGAVIKFEPDGGDKK